MNKVLTIALLLLGFVSCSEPIPDEDTDYDVKRDRGSIYGIVTIKETGEPMRATGVELFQYGSLLLKTVTYDDGHYEFENLIEGEYKLKVTAAGFQDIQYSVTVEAKRTARADMQLERLKTGMTVRTLEATEIGGGNATLNGTYTYSSYKPTEVGFVYSTSPSPSNGGTIINSTLDATFSAVISNLKKGKYYFQAYAKNSIGTEYGTEISFEVNGQPGVSTLEATNVTETTATINGRIDYEGDPAYTEKGFVYSSSFPNPTIDDPATATTRVVISGTSKEFSANIAGLTKNSIFYVRAYATNSAGTVYGNAVEVSNSDYIILYSDGIMVQRYDISPGANWSDAYKLCTSSKIGGYSDWRLPTIGECGAIEKQKHRLNIDVSTYYWTSETSTSWQYDYRSYNFSNACVYNASKSNTYRVRAVRTIK